MVQSASVWRDLCCLGGHAATGHGDSGQSTLLDLPTGQPTTAELHIEKDRGGKNGSRGQCLTGGK